jgi:hypothetical protein
MRRRVAIAAVGVLVAGVVLLTVVVPRVFCWNPSAPVLCRLSGTATIAREPAAGGGAIDAGKELVVPAGSEAQVVLPQGLDLGLLIARSRGSTVELKGPSAVKFAGGQELLLLSGHAQVHYRTQRPFTVIGGVGVVRLSSPAELVLDESAGFGGNVPALSVRVTSGVVRANSTEAAGSTLLHAGDSTRLALTPGH